MAATIKDIARRTGLGLATISSYLNGGNVREKNRIKIEEAIEELDFEVNEVARGLKTNRTKTIGVIIPELNNIFCSEIITGIEDILRSHGYATIICDCRSDRELEREAVEFLCHRRVDGIVNMPVNTSSDYLGPFLRLKKPIVFIDRKLEDVQGDSVLVDNQSASRMAVEKLIQAGHRNIGIVAGPLEIFTANQRVEGYRQALQGAGIPFRESLEAYGDYTISSGVGCMRRLIEKNKDMTAVFATNYELTMGAVIEINEKGIKIPEDLSFIGFDNAEFARACTPRLSIIEQPAEGIADQAAHILLRRLEGEAFPSCEVVLQTRFAEGKSVVQQAGK